ncbi:MAG: dockerin type I domain-containing protein [Pirellulales bacterium]
MPIVFLFAQPLSAGVLDDIGFTRLKQEQGDAISTGDRVAVAQSEALLSTDLYYPLTTNADFAGKTFLQGSGPHGVSSHATDVGQYFYGLSRSVSPGVTSVTNYTAVGWLNGDQLKTLSSQLPAASVARVANHSWISSGFGGEVLNSLQRMDWLVETDDFVQVAGVNNLSGGVEAPAALFASAFNVITVGVSTGNHSTGATDLPFPPYTAANRVRPHLVAPMNQTSFAAPLVASTATLLIDLAIDHPGLSNGTQISSPGRNNRKINNGETSEVIRAALMAGADRQAITQRSNGYVYDPSSTSGLDPRFGAGQLDVYQSYHVVSGGEQDARERGNVADIKMYGFDYEPSYVAGQARTYRFSVDEVSREFAASLAWNVDIDLQLANGVYQDQSVVLKNLNLLLRDVVTGQTIASSNGGHDVTENLYVPILGQGQYELAVSAANYSVVNPWTVDYALAWRFAPSSTPMMGDVNLDGTVSLIDLAQLQRNFNMTERAVWTDGDLNGDGRVDRADVGMLAGTFGGGAIPQSLLAPIVGNSPGFAPRAIPEPSSVALAMCGGLTLVVLSRRGRPCRQR